VPDFLPCPFCGGLPEVTKHFREDMWSLIHRCKVVGTIAIEWLSSPEHLKKLWNTREAKGA